MGDVRIQGVHQLDLGVTLGLQYGPGPIAEEVVLAVAVRHVGELGRDPVTKASCRSDNFRATINEATAPRAGVSPRRTAIDEE